MARYRYRTTRFLPIVLIVVVIIIAIIAIIALGRAVFHSGSTSSTPAAVDTSQTALLNTDDSSSVRMTVRGPIVAEENFRSYQITISPSTRSLQTFKGYLDSVIDQVQLDNNTDAYTQFVYALNKANLAKGTADDSDIRGICASGEVYQFDIMSSGTPVKTLWTSTCSGSRGTLRANTAQLANLFQVQIPGGAALIQKVGL